MLMKHDNHYHDYHVSPFVHFCYHNPTVSNFTLFFGKTPQSKGEIQMDECYTFFLVGDGSKTSYEDRFYERA
jgi:hypothetical protein